MSDTFKRTFHVGWGTIDFNAHMRNTAYLDLSADIRMMYFESRGFPMREFERLRIGPVVMKDELEYRRELRLLELTEVSLELAGISEDGSRFKLRNTFCRPGGKVAAIVSTEAGWLDIENRRLVAPPDVLHQAMRSLPVTSDFISLPSSVRREKSR